MSLFFSVESLKIYKNKHQVLVNSLFILLFGINISLLLMPFFNQNVNFYAYEKLFDAVKKLVQFDDFFNINVYYLSSLFTYDIIMHILATVFVKAFGLFLQFLYVAIYFEFFHKADNEIKQVSFNLRKAVKLICYLLLIFVIGVFSSLLFFIPWFLFLIYSYYTVPYILMYDMSLFKAIKASHRAVKKHTGVIIFSIIILGFCKNLFLSIFLGIIDSALWISLANAFFIAYFTLAYGRLMAILFLEFARPGVLQAKNMKFIENTEEFIDELVHRQREGLDLATYDAMYQKPDLQEDLK